jgi:DedD protein
VKERLTGAIILVALMVLLVPELLTGPIRPKSAPTASSTAASSTATSAHAGPPLRSYTLTLGGAPPGHDAAAAPTAHDITAAPAAGAPAQPAVIPLRGSSQSSAPSLQAAPATESGLQVTKPAAHRVVAEARSASPAGGGWVVQLGSFASRQNADRLARSLERRGFRMSVSPARAGARVLWRVRAGPAHDRAGAQHLGARLQALGHRGELLPVK